MCACVWLFVRLLRLSVCLTAAFCFYFIFFYLSVCCGHLIRFFLFFFRVASTRKISTLVSFEWVVTAFSKTYKKINSFCNFPFFLNPQPRTRKQLFFWLFAQLKIEFKGKLLATRVTFVCLVVVDFDYLYLKQVFIGNVYF